MKLKKSLFTLLLLIVLSFSINFFITSREETGYGQLQCVVVDNDGSLDDLRALAFLSCSSDKPPTHIIFTEGVVKPIDSLRNYLYLRKHHNFAEPFANLILGSETHRELDTFWKHVRKRDRLFNNYFKKKKNPVNINHQASKNSFSTLIKDCSSIDLLITGPYTSAIEYWPAISKKVNRVVTMGGGESKYFNCWYDMKSCKEFFSNVKNTILSSVNVPETRDKKLSFSYNREIVNSLNDSKTLLLWKDIFLADPSGWSNGDLLLWDDLTSMYFLDASDFKKIDDYWEPSKIPTSYINRWKDKIKACDKTTP